MKKLILLASVLFLSFGLDGAAFAQGTIVFNNLGTNNGLVFIYPFRFGGTPTLLNQDISFSLFAGPPGMNPLMLAHRWLLSDGSAKGINVGPGCFADPSASVFSISGIAPGDPVNVQLQAWAGNYNGASEALGAGAVVNSSSLFTMFAGSAAAPPASLDRMPRFDIFGVPSIPEPGTIKLMSIGGLALWFLLCRSRR